MESSSHALSADGYVFSRNLEPVAGPAAEHDMFSGRLRTSVQKAWSGTLSRTNTTTGLQYYHFNSICVAPTDGSIETNDDTCDPVLASRVVRTGCNDSSDNTPAAGLVGVKAHDNFAGAPATNTGENQAVKCPSGCACQFDVVVANRGPGEALMDIRWLQSTTNAHPTWNHGSWSTSFGGVFDRTNGNDQYVGGTVLDVGPLNNGDTLGVNTVDGGASSAQRVDTWLVNETNEGWLTASSSSLAPPADNDPRISISGTAWSNLHDDHPNLLIVSKQSRVLTSTAWSDHEIDVEIVRGPLGIVYNQWITASCASGSESDRKSCQSGFLGSSGSSLIAPGRYSFYVLARADGAGETNGELGADPWYSADVEAESGFCQGGECSGLTTCGGRYRGRANNLAFTLEVRKYTGGRWVTIAQRHVPRAYLAAENATVRVGIDVEVERADGEANYYYAIAVVNSAVTLNTVWWAERNVDATELKIAHLNHEYEHGAGENASSLHNSVDLLIGKGTSLATRGTARFIHYRRGRVWEFGADYGQLQEVLQTSLSYVADHVLTDSDHHVGADWNLMKGFGKVIRKEVGSTTPRHNVSFTNRWLNGERFDWAVMNAAGCGLGGAQGGPVCKVAEMDYPVVSAAWYSLPIKLDARSLDGARKPIVVFNSYFPHTWFNDTLFHGVATSETERLAALVELVDRMEALLAQEPAAFNAAGSRDPRHPGNRMIIMGDLNMSNMGCAEMNVFVRYLRYRFGYALDLATAQLDADARTLDGHYSGEPIYDQLGYGYGSCAGLPVDDPSAVGCTPSFKTQSHWETDGANRFSSDPEQHYPWWAGTKAVSGGKRLDVIILVGNGWRNDDPLRKYMPMSSRSDPSFVNGYQGGGVEYAAPRESGDACELSDQVTDAADDSYPPRHEACPLGGIRGRGAVHSDHLAIGARLRLQ